MSLAAFSLVASEFMPVSLLTPVAQDLHMSAGQAGQAISVSGAFAVLTSLAIPVMAGSMDRRRLMALLILLMIVSGAVVTFAPTATVFMIGRALIGVAIGGFWSMSTAAAIRLVPAAKVPRALAIVNGGNALATVIAAPAGSYLGSIVGWRWAFFCLVPVAAIALVWHWISVPRMPGREATRPGAMLRLLAHPPVMWGMAAAALLFMGQFALFTYLRPFLEGAVHVHASMLSGLLLTIGVAGLLGTMLIGTLLEKDLYRPLMLIPLLMAVIAMGLPFVTQSVGLTAVLLGLWGLLGTAAPVGWWTWLAQTLPADAEAGGGLMVAVVQLAIGLGATCGGLLFDMGGYRATFDVSACILVAAALAAVAARAAAARATRLDAAVEAQ